MAKTSSHTKGAENQAGKVNGWTLLAHDCFLEQLHKLKAAADRAYETNPAEAESNASVKLFQAVSTLVMKNIPDDPSHAKYRQGKTLGKKHILWRRAKIGRRFRLFFRYDSTSKIIIYAWLNDESSLRSAGSNTDPYAIFQKMLNRGNPPSSWDELLAEAKKNMLF